MRASAASDPQSIHCCQLNYERFSERRDRAVPDPQGIHRCQLHYVRFLRRTRLWRSFAGAKRVASRAASSDNLQKARTQQWTEPGRILCRRGDGILACLVTSAGRRRTFRVSSFRRFPQKLGSACIQTLKMRFLPPRNAHVFKDDTQRPCCATDEGPCSPLNEQIGNQTRVSDASITSLKYYACHVF